MKRVLLLMLLLAAMAPAENLSSLPRTIAWSPDDQLVAVAHEDKVSVYDLSSKSKLYSLDSPRTTSLAFSPDGKTLALSRAGEWLFLHRARNGERLWKSGSGRKPEDARYTGLSVFFLPDGQLITVGAEYVGRSAPDPFLRWYNPGTGQQVRKLAFIGAFATLDRKLAAVTDRDRLDLIDLATGKVLRTLRRSDSLVSIGLLEPGEKFIEEEQGPQEGSKRGPGTLLLIDVSSGKEEKLSKIPPVVGSMPDGRLIRAYGDGIYDPATRKTVITKGWPQDAAGSLVVVDDLSGPLRVLDSRTGQLKLTLPEGSSMPFFSHDGKSLASRSATATVIYDTSTWKPVLQLP
ncbi:hypothetical protein DYH09_17130 [bacterium CPR1]|nr:hypothetical protein [bacterium CPR1]